jgi:CheY-like chemotaxis protein/anti-sigma regulatory factor (Ser/Thr protein kinase)
MNEAVNEMSGVLRRTLGERFSIDTQLAPDLPSTRVDPSKLEHVLMNLVLNARDAMVDGGRIRICTAVSQLHDDHSGLVPPGQWVTLSVRDEGTGIDEAHRSRIFDPFFTTKPASEGTGLGLATVYGIVKQSGGHIEVRSELEQGTEFTIFLPIVDDTDEPDDVAVERRSLRPGARLLVVDDAPAVRHVLARGLEAAGFVVSEANSARAALALLWDQPDVDAVISDIIMPDGSGIELANELARTAPHLPVLLISGDLHGQDLSALPAGVRTLQKPVTAARLIEELGAMMRGDSA